MTAKINRPASKSIPARSQRRSREQMHGATIDAGNRGIPLPSAHVNAALRRHG
jgi:hypothetical protein